MEIERGTGISGRTKPTNEIGQNVAKFCRVRTLNSGSFFATGSERGNSGFVIQTPGDVEIHLHKGDVIQANTLSTGVVYEIGVHFISGSGTVHVLYP